MTTPADILVPLLLAHPAEFDAIPDALRPAVRRLILAAARAERGRVVERVKGVANALNAGVDPQFYTGYKTGVELQRSH